MTSLSSEVPSLTAPTLLIAMPQVLDPFFARTVVFLVHHDAEGSLGYIVNRETEIPVKDICSGLGIEWGGVPGAKVGFGGPVQAEVGAVIYRGEPGLVVENSFHVPPDLHITANREDLKRLAAKPPADFRLLLGYAGWGPGQIDTEFLRGDWLTAEPDRALLFASELDDVWAAALRSIGVEPGVLPSLGPDDASTVN